MAHTKVTLYFEQATEPGDTPFPARTAGWTESYYFNGDPSAAEDNAQNNEGLAAKRAACLPKSGIIIGVRYQQVEPGAPGAVKINRTAYKGEWAGTEVPQMAILVYFPGENSNNRRIQYLRGIPDSQVTGGTFVPTVGYNNALTAFYQKLVPYAIRGIDRSNPLLHIVEVGATGIVTTVENHGLAVGNDVHLTRMYQANGLRIPTLTTKVTAVGSPTTFTLASWPSSAIAKKGNVRKLVVGFFDIDVPKIKVARIGVRKAGRPFDLYTGRRSG